MSEADARADGAALGSTSQNPMADGEVKPPGGSSHGGLSPECLDVIGTAHQLNNLLITICGLTQLLVEDADDPAVKEDLSVVLDQSRKASYLVTDLLEAYKGTSRKVEHVDINSLLEEVVSGMHPRLKSGGVCLESSFGDGLPPVSVVPRQLKQVFESILNNAVIALRKAEPPRKVSVETWGDGPYVNVEIRDQGPGIDPEILPFVFDPFFTTREREHGTGLGLAVSQGIVRGFSGEMGISSRKGSGTTVSVRLPAARGGNRRDSTGNRLLSRRYSLRRAYGNRAARRARCTVWR